MDNVVVIQPVSDGRLRVELSRDQLAEILGFLDWSEVEACHVDYNESHPDDAKTIEQYLVSCHPLRTYTVEWRNT